jgi:putative transcriptional regulator
MGVKKEKSSDLILLGQRLRTIRERKQLTLKQLGHLINKDPQSISRVEMGDINPTYLYLLQLCKGLEIKLAEIAPDQSNPL